VEAPPRFLTPQVPLSVSVLYPMFTNGTGHHIHGGIFYNVGGDVNLRNLQSHHNLTIQNRHTGCRPLLGWTSGFEDARDRTLEKRRALTNCDLPEAGVDVPDPESDRDWGGVSRSEHQGVAARTKPYGTLEASSAMVIPSHVL
jgi:hypothetical protein